MSKILILVSAVLLLGSSALSYLNKNKLAAVQDILKTVQTGAASSTSDAAKARTDLKKAQGDLKEATQKAADVQTQLASAQAQTTDLDAKLKAANDAVTAKDAELALAKQQAPAAPVNTGTVPAADVAKQMDDLKRQADELRVVKDGLQSQNDSAVRQVAALQKRLNDIESKASMNGLRGRVLAVDRQWNFVVIDLGVNRGVSSNTTMIVERGGSLVGKVRVTSVEPSQSIADIIPNSVPAGVAVQAGDTVYFSGT